MLGSSEELWATDINWGVSDVKTVLDEIMQEEKSEVKKEGKGRGKDPRKDPRSSTPYIWIRNDKLGGKKSEG